MDKKYFKKIIAKSTNDLQFISACCHQAKVKVSDMKYLPKNKIFIMSLERYNIERETEEKKSKINSIIKFEFVDSVKSKNVNQNDLNLVLELFTIDLFKNKKNFEINLIFSNNAYITLSTEIVEVTLEDQNKDL